jgi:hypothetical protein
MLRERSCEFHPELPRPSAERRAIDGLWVEGPGILPVVAPETEDVAAWFEGGDAEGVWVCREVVAGRAVIGRVAGPHARLLSRAPLGELGDRG